jgi:CPA1 family monovalent cation:H+ antiporter
LPLTAEVILLLFLPPLLFEAAFALDLPLLWSEWRGILVLAVPGVFLATGVTGVLVHWTAALPWSIALLFGAMIAATDPVSVLATLRQLQVEPRLRMLLEGESLFNDGTALALFLSLVSAVGAPSTRFPPCWPAWARCLAGPSSVWRLVTSATT